MPVLPSAISAKGKYALGQADLAVPDHLISPRDQEDWAYYAACLPPAKLIGKFAEALDQFHGAYHHATTPPRALSLQEKDFLHSKWNAASIFAVQIVERLEFEAQAQPPAFKDVISESLFFLTQLLDNIGAGKAVEWEGRAVYYNAIDSLFMQDIVDESFERQNQARQPRFFHQSPRPG